MPQGLGPWICPRLCCGVAALHHSHPRRIIEEELRGRARAAYGERLIERLSAVLTRRFGRGFSKANLKQMREFYMEWVAPTIGQTASDQFAGSTHPPGELPRVRFPLPWSHYVRLLSVEKPEARAFYEAEALRGGWTVRQLDRQIGTQFYERTLNGACQPLTSGTRRYRRRSPQSWSPRRFAPRG